MYGRNSASGTYGYFKDVALFGGDYSPEVREQPGSSTVIQGVAADIGGIGYSGVGYGTADVRRSRSAAPTAKCYGPTARRRVGQLPDRAVPLHLHERQPERPLEPLRAEFVRYVYSQQGQAGRVRAGFFPLVKAIADQDLKTFGLH
jgi:phosphate transport system substrate-binding protein